MITIINSSLFTYGVKDEFEDKISGTTSQRISFGVSNSILKPPSRPSLEGNSRLDATTLVPMKAEIFSYTMPKDANVKLEGNNNGFEYFVINAPTVAKFDQIANRRQISVSARVLRDDEYSKNDLYVVAVPFNGLIKEIKPDPAYNIYKGFIASSSRQFIHDGYKYKKILYLVIEPNKDYKEFTLTVNSAANFTDKKTSKAMTDKKKFTLNVKIGEGFSVESDIGTVEGSDVIQADGNIFTLTPIPSKPEKKEYSKKKTYVNNRYTPSYKDKDEDDYDNKGNRSKPRKPQPRTRENYQDTHVSLDMFMPAKPQRKPRSKKR